MDGLYNTDILTLAATIEHLGQLQAPQGSARKVSKLCGSWVEVDVNMDGETVSKFAIRLQACALGQASASILSQNAIGATFTELGTARDALKAMLKDGAPAPQGRFAELVKLKDVANYPARHTSTLLAFEAVLAAIAVAKSP
ncbi:MAG TPA: iron-sulfur cluster assembly scaffold protein [Hellea balneolensis]|uniref:Iron-sulfur cluster assembly scaffold protein n=1 Tax=Hellea balneolensis TaxID=287478 RepID=A0A7C5QVJ8_9PROT|nr:iron-sulfur cluster assembly scaffold protein [Hellea balneolensis]